MPSNEKRVEGHDRDILSIPELKNLYTKVTEAENGVPQFFPHDCAYCIELCKNPRHVRTIQEIAPRELPGMIYRQMSIGAMKERLGASSPANG